MLETLAIPDQGVDQGPDQGVDQGIEEVHPIRYSIRYLIRCPIRWGVKENPPPPPVCPTPNHSRMISDVSMGKSFENILF